MRHSSGRLAADGDQFGGNGYGDFFGRDGSDIETDRSMHAVEKMGRDALLLERLENLNNLTLGADHADIAGTSLNGPPEVTHIAPSSSGDEHPNVTRVGDQMLPGLRDGLYINPP